MPIALATGDSVAPAPAPVSAAAPAPVSAANKACSTTSGSADTHTGAVASQTADAIMQGLVSVGLECEGVLLALSTLLTSGMWH